MRLFPKIAKRLPVQIAIFCMRMYTFQHRRLLYPRGSKPAFWSPSSKPLIPHLWLPPGYRGKEGPACEGGREGASATASTTAHRPKERKGNPPPPSIPPEQCESAGWKKQLEPRTTEKYRKEGKKRRRRKECCGDQPTLQTVSVSTCISQRKKVFFGERRKSWNFVATPEVAIEASFKVTVRKAPEAPGLSF